jgi:L-asparaginase II
VHERNVPLQASVYGREVDEPVLVEVVRSGLVESRHRGSVVGLAADGSTALAVGDPSRPVYGRSANKPLQATAMVELGLDLRPELLALVCASHNGERRHVEGVRRILASVGLDESALANTADLPLHVPAAHDVIRAGGRRAPLLQNCSGKHAGMLAVSVLNGWPLASYVDPDHPLQRHITTVIERMSGETVTHLGVDGCGAPAHTLTLTGLARAFASVGRAGADAPAGTVGAAIRAHPDMVGGTGRDITALLIGVPGLVAKDGAEGVLAAAMPDGRAVALKLADGSWRGFAGVMLAALDRLGVDTSGAAGLREAPVLGGGRPVGESHAVGLA